MLSKAWFQLSADMSYVCLRITPGLTEPIQESDVLALLRLSNCRRYEPLGEGIREAVTLLNALIAEPDAPAHPPVPIARRQDARLLIQVEKDQMSARAQITADWGGQPLTLARLQEALAASTVKQGVSERLLAAAIQAEGEAAPGAQLNPVIALGKAVKRQALVLGFSDTFAVIGVMLAIAAVLLLLARKGKPSGAAAAH